MGPMLVRAAKAKGFDPEAWGTAMKAAEARDFDQTVAALAAQEAEYVSLLSDMTDADFRGEMRAFDGSTITRGAFIVNMVLGGHAAYRTQLFLYLKACGREELGTSNLWRGADPPVPAAAV
jgi:hypothetical protein